MTEQRNKKEEPRIWDLDPETRNPKPGTRNLDPHRPIISIGDLVADLTLSGLTLPVQAGRHQLADSISLEPGGAGNFLITGARLGHPMAAVGLLGDDHWGHRVASQLRSEGIDLCGVQHSGTTTLVVVLSGQSGEHVFVGKRGEGSPFRLDERVTGLIKSGAAVYCSGYTLSEPGLADQALQILRLAKQQGLPTLFDPGPLMTDKKLLRESVLPLVDTLFLSQDEVPLVTDGPLSELTQQGPGVVVVKRGVQGCTIYSKSDAGDGPGSPLQMRGYPVQVTDTSGAGDCFNAAFTVAALRGWPLPDCAKLANAVGVAKVQKLGGGRNVPTLDEVQRVISEFEIGIEI